MAELRIKHLRMVSFVLVCAHSRGAYVGRGTLLK